MARIRLAGRRRQVHRCLSVDGEQAPRLASAAQGAMCEPLAWEAPELRRSMRQPVPSRLSHLAELEYLPRHVMIIRAASGRALRSRMEGLEERCVPTLGDIRVVDEVEPAVDMATKYQLSVCRKPQTMRPPRWHQCAGVLSPGSLRRLKSNVSRFPRAQRRQLASCLLTSIPLWYLQEAN